MNQSKSSLPLSNLWQRNYSNSDEFETLLNQIEKTAIVFDLKRKVFVQANSKFLQLTMFSLSELKEKKVSDIFPGLDITKLISGDNIESDIQKRNKDVISRRIKTISFSENSNLVLFLIEDEDTGLTGNERNRETLLEYLFDLHNDIYILSFEEVISNIIQLISYITDKEQVIIYKYVEQKKGYKAIALNDNRYNFPDFFIDDGTTLHNAPQIWEPGKKVENEIHRVGRIKNLAYLGIIPFGSNDKVRGFIIIGGDKTKIDNWNINYIKLLGGMLHSAMFYQSRQIEIKRLIAEKEKEIFQLSKIIDNIDIGVLILNSELIIREINPSAEILLGYSLEEIVGEDIGNILIGTDNLYSALESARSNIQTPNLGNSKLHRRNGQAFPAHIQVYPISDTNNLLSIVIFISDISEHEEIRRRTQQLEQRAVIGELTAIFAHEVRNPINNISTGLQLLITKIKEDDKNKDLVNRMQGDCSRLTTLMDSVLAFSRPMEPKFEQLNVVELIQRILGKWNSRLKRVHIECHFSMEEDTPKILGDPRALEQVFTNLINNSIEVMKESGGTLAIKVKTNYDISKYRQVEVTFADNGPGIPDDIKNRIFEPFVSASSNGTGLGLAITKRIVTAHRGSICVESFPGGTIFKLLFPEVNGDEHGTNNINC